MLCGLFDYWDFVSVFRRLETPDMRTAARPRRASIENRAEFTTGLMIGNDHSSCMMHLDKLPWLLCYKPLGCHAGTAEEQAASRMRKEQYRQELLTQIAEQQRNKMRWVFIPPEHELFQPTPQWWRSCWFQGEETWVECRCHKSHRPRERGGAHWEKLVA